MPVEISPNLRDLYERLLVADVQAQLPGESLGDLERLGNDDYARLIGLASSLAFSDDHDDKTIAYEIVTRTLEIVKDSIPDLLVAGSILLARLGNFPGRDLLHSRYMATAEAKPKFPIYLSLESTAREIENSVDVGVEKPLLLTDFQKNLFDDLASASALSASAPTSAGKSFVLSLDVVRRLQEEPPSSIVYIVPTRALIRQVMKTIGKALRTADLLDVPLRCVPLPLSRSQAKKGAVYVLTQERLLSLLYSSEGQAWITTLIIDEAQGIKDGPRGILLQSAIEEVQRRFPGLNLFFLSPLAKNPEYLLYLFATRDSTQSRTEEHSPVSQNLILVSEVHRKTNQAHFDLLIGEKRLDLGSRDLGFRLRDGIYEQRANLARAVTGEDDCTIIYADGPKYAERIADYLIEDLTSNEKVDQVIAEFVEFLKVHIHPEYPLIRHLPHGVAYHYGLMPAIVRSRVEDLCSDGKLRFICCTSTLLQGVNLPARNIVIDNPRRGPGNVMSRAAFLNLAGRAGRLLKEFHGNIWCIRPNKWDNPDGSDTPCYEGERLQDIGAAFEEVLGDGGMLIQRLLGGETLKPSELDLASSALGKVFSDYTQTELSLEFSRYANEGNLIPLRETERLCAEIQVTLPAIVFRRNATILPQRLQSLYNFLATELDISLWIPLLPHEDGFYERTKQIFGAVQRLLNEVDDESYSYDAWLAWQWIHDKPLRVIIDERIQRDEGRSVRDSIYELLSDLEKRIRYLYVKHTLAYEDILTLILNEQEKTDLLPKVPPLHLFLECGTSNHVVLSLISLGLSRNTSLLLKGKVQFPDEATPEVCFEILRSSNVDEMKLPGVCKRELEALLGISD